MSNTTEVSTVDMAAFSKLAANLGHGAQEDDNSSPKIPFIKTVHDDEDSKGRELKRGMFYLKNGQEPIYAKKITIQPLTQHFQYINFDPVQEKVVCKSIMDSNVFRGEFRDTNGTVRCGKPISKVIKSDTDAGSPAGLKERYKSISCFRQVRCLVEYEGHDADGNAVSVESTPALLMLKGVNFLPFEQEFLSALPKGHSMYTYKATLTNTRQKQGSVVYFTTSFEGDFAQPQPITQKIFDTMSVINDMVSEENVKIEAAYRAALTESQKSDAAVDAMQSLDDDLVDDAVLVS